LDSIGFINCLDSKIRIHMPAASAYCGVMPFPGETR
jgi:hypothetical protein